MLHYTVAKNDYEMTKFLIPKFTEIDIKNDDGKTPLSIAWIAGNIEILKLLYKYGAKVVSTVDEESPLCLSIHHGHFFWTL